MIKSHIWRTTREAGKAGLGCSDARAWLEKSLRLLQSGHKSQVSGKLAVVSVRDRRRCNEGLPGSYSLARLARNSALHVISVHVLPLHTLTYFIAVYLPTAKPASCAALEKTSGRAVFRHCMHLHDSHEKFDVAACWTRNRGIHEETAPVSANPRSASPLPSQRLSLAAAASPFHHTSHVRANPPLLGGGSADRTSLPVAQRFHIKWTARPQAPVTLLRPFSCLCAQPIPDSPGISTTLFL